MYELNCISNRIPKLCNHKRRIYNDEQKTIGKIKVNTEP